MSEKEKPTGLNLLRAPFAENQISLLPKPFKKDSPKGNCSECGGYHGLPAAHLKYVGHAALTDRLLDADLFWSWEPLSVTADGQPFFDKTGGLWIKLMICGVERLGYGNAQDSSFKEVGSREKEIIGDALRNAAMRFGAALDLWHKGDLHLSQEEAPAKPQEAKFQPPASVQARLVAAPPMQKPLFPKVMQSSEDLGSYVVKIGKKYKDLMLSEIDIHDLNGYVKYFIDGSIRDKKPLDAKTSEFVEAAETFLKSRLASNEQPKWTTEEAPMPDDSDIPF